MPLTQLNTIGKNTRQKLLTKYSWDFTAKVYEEIFDNININAKRAWNAPMLDINLKHSVMNIKNNRDFIYDIVDNIIKDKKLKSTTFIEDLIRSLDDETIVNGQQVYQFKRQDAIKLLEVYANNKHAIEMMRISNNYQSLPKLISFFEYSKK